MKHRQSLNVVILGILGRVPLAGVGWQALHYLEGFRRLGCNVHYIEDTGAWPYDPVQNTVTADVSYSLKFLGNAMEWCGLAGRWAYRASSQDGEWFGLSEAGVADALSGCDVLVNLTGATVLREAHLGVPVRVYVETDPVLPQVEIAQGKKFTIDLLAAHTHHFTYGENFGAPDCLVPVGQFRYWPTRQPVVLDWWQHAASAVRPNECFTTVGTWKQSGKDIEWNGETYTWSKHHEFLNFLDLPRRISQPFELAMACSPDDRQTLESHGWRVVDGLRLTRDLFSYRDFLWRSRGEFTVAKDQNIRMRSGWFSDRSACYLGAGRPVVTQDTGFGNILPVGSGLFAFRTMEEIIAAIEEINRDYEKHSRAAREIAAEYFSAERVLGTLLEQVQK